MEMRGRNTYSVILLGGDDRFLYTALSAQHTTETKTYGHLGEVATEDTGDVMGGVGLVFPIQVFAVLYIIFRILLLGLTCVRTDPWRRFKDALEIAHALVGSVYSKYALDFGCWGDCERSNGKME